MVQDDDTEVPETHVLAIASHTQGNIWTLGCEVSAIHTVNYSNHVAYKTFTGRRTTPAELTDLYTGLQNARLNSFDMLLSGYCPSAALVQEVGKIARDLKTGTAMRPGGFFWVMDPVMGDNGRIYVAEECVDAYKSLVEGSDGGGRPDLILPNGFEAELLSGTKIVDMESVHRIMSRLHAGGNGVPNVLITSLRLPKTAIGTPTNTTTSPAPPVAKLSIIGSTATSTGAPRLFRITVPALPIFFSGTGDMFAALLVARLRQAARAANVLATASWQPDDSVPGPQLPLAKAAEKVLASMHAVLRDTAEHYEMAAREIEVDEMDRKGEGEGDVEREMSRHLKLTRAAEVRVVRNTRALREPPDLQDFQAQAVDVDAGGSG